jgi:hypothetical protein
MAVFASTNPPEFDDLLSVLGSFKIDVQRDLIDPGKNETQAAAQLNGAFRQLGWREGDYLMTYLSRQTLRPYKPAGETKPLVTQTEVDAASYKIDNLKGKVAVDVEWHAKDGNLDRDIAAYRSLYEVGMIEAAAIITVSQSELKAWAKKVDPASTKFATTTTTNIEKAIPRLQRGDAGGCPLVVIGVGNKTV